MGAAFLSAGGNLLPGIFLPQFSIVLGYSAAFGAVLTISNGVASASQTLTGFAGDKFGRQNTLIFMVTFSLISTLAFWLSSILTLENGAKGSWLAFIVFYGIAGGVCNALFPTMVAEVFGMQSYASVNGFMYFTRGLGAMVGGPVGGKTLGSGENRLSSWKSVVWFDAAMLAGAAVCVVGVRILHTFDRREWSGKLEEVRSILLVVVSTTCFKLQVGTSAGMTSNIFTFIVDEGVPHYHAALLQVITVISLQFTLICSQFCFEVFLDLCFPGRKVIIQVTRNHIPRASLKQSIIRIVSPWGKGYSPPILT